MSQERSAKRQRTENDSSNENLSAAGHGFGNFVQSEAIAGALPPRGNTPMKCPFGLYAEQLSGSSFTTPRLHNQRTWLYRVRPAADHGDYEKAEGYDLLTANWTESAPDQFRWMPETIPSVVEKKVDFLQGLVCYGGSGDPALRTGFAIYFYTANTDMDKQAFFDSDGDLLIVPEHGALNIWTELGRMVVSPHEICVIPRGIKFSISKVDGVDIRGYVCEVFEGHFQLPDLGPIGANGLANVHDFEIPAAAFMPNADKDEEWVVFQKFNHTLHKFKQNHTPFDVVAWRGNYAPCKYNLDKFCTINTVSYDHIDPSIFTVLTCPTPRVGVAVIDFVIFPPRWSVATDTFRPPYYHRNCMTEFMGMVVGQYEAKPATATGKSFGPGGATLHSCMSAHGPASSVFEKESNADLKPCRVAEGSLAFMFESHYIMKLTKWAVDNHDPEYRQCWNNFKVHFQAPKSA